MKLKDLINDLNQHRENREQYSARVLVRNPDVAPDAHWSLRYDKNPIIDIYIDHDDSEIDIIIKHPGQKDNAHPWLTLAEFSARLEGLPAKCKNYTVCVGCWTTEPQDEFSIRVDVDIVGVVTSKENLFFGLIQWHPGCLEEFKKK